MIQNFIKTDIHDYSNLMKSKKIQAIFHNMPKNLNQLEKAYFVYLELGKILSENPKDVLDSTENRVHRFGTNIDDSFYGVCLSISELYAFILKDERIGIEADVINRSPPKILSHYDNMLRIDGKNYMVSLIRDLTNIKTYDRTSWFCFNLKDFLDKRITGLMDSASKEGIDKETIRYIVRTAIDSNSTQVIEDFIKTQKEKSGHDLSNIHRYLLNNVFDHAYLGYIRDAYHSVTYLEKSDLEIMDLKFGYSFGSIQSENGNHKRGIYKSDVLDLMTKELSNNDTAREFILHGQHVHKSELLDYKLKFIIENISKFIETNNDLNYLEQVANFKFFASRFISSEEFKRIELYALKVGESENDFISLIKLKPYNEDGKNKFYLYSPDNKKYEEKSMEELKEKYNNAKILQIAGKFRTYDGKLASIKTPEDFEMEMLD